MLLKEAWSKAKKTLIPARIKMTQSQTTKLGDTINSFVPGVY